MNQNLGNLDRILRVVIGAILLLSGLFLAHGAWRFVLVLVSLVPFATSLVGYCPLYAALKLSTKRELRHA